MHLRLATQDGGCKYNISSTKVPLFSIHAFISSAIYEQITMVYFNHKLSETKWSSFDRKQNVDMLNTDQNTCWFIE